MAIRDGNLVPANGTPINTPVRGRLSGPVYMVESNVATLLQQLRVFVQGHTIYLFGSTYISHKKFAFLIVKAFIDTCLTVSQAATSQAPLGGSECREYNWMRKPLCYTVRYATST